MSRSIFLSLVVMLATNLQAYGIIFYSTADPNFNTTPPTGSLANSGWQWQGYWGGFLGTPIGPHHFITAWHVGGAVGDVFTFNGVPYQTTALYDGNGNDLRIWQISGSFPTWAPLYRGADELGKTLMVFGKGLGRGVEVRVNGVLKGWQYAGGGGLKWGQNTVSEVRDYGTGYGFKLRAAFDAAGGPNEAHLANGDSGGAVFIQESNIWKLAGINGLVDASFNFTTTGTGFYAALFDAGGLFTGSGGNWQYIPDQPYDIPTSFYSSRISSYLPWIDGIVASGYPSDAADAPLFPPAGALLLGVSLLCGGVATIRRVRLGAN